MTHIDSISPTTSLPPSRPRWTPPLPLYLLQPVLRRIVNRIATENPDMFGRLGPHFNANFIIDPTNLPFVMQLRPDPDDLLLKAVPRKNLPAHDAKISGSFMDLLMLVDGDLDGDALFFARDLTITGNTEAVVCLRNALDDIDGSIAASVAEMFGPAGRTALNAIRRANTKQGTHI
jgi:predicted lipid carrier protein YhbT